MKNVQDKLEEIFEDLEICFDGSLKEGVYELEFWASEGGMDCINYITFKPGDIKDFLEELDDYIFGYNLKEELQIMLQAREAPDTITVLADCIEKKERLQELFWTIKEQLAEPSKPLQKFLVEGRETRYVSKYVLAKDRKSAVQKFQLMYDNNEIDSDLHYKKRIMDVVSC